MTGAGGFIGSHLVEQLTLLGAHVRAFIRYTSRGNPGLLRFIPASIFSEIEIISGDLRDSDAIRKAAEGCQIIFHLGSLISIPYSYKHPREVIEANILGTLNALEAARSNDVQRLIHTSTSEVYGTAQHVPIDEGHPLQGQSPYSASKIGADHLVESYWRSFGVPAVTLRPFNAYGPRQSARAVIPTIITQALKSDTIFLGSFHPTRDFTFVTDTVAAFIALAETEGLIGQEINIGSGAEISISDLVQKIASLIGKPLTMRSEEQRKRPSLSEVERLLADNRKAKQMLGWSPEVDLDTGLSQTIAWINEHLDFYRPGVYQT